MLIGPRYRPQKQAPQKKETMNVVSPMRMTLGPQLTHRDEKTVANDIVLRKIL